MSDAREQATKTSADEAHTAGSPAAGMSPVGGAAFKRQLFGGYDRKQVDAWVLDGALQVVELREQLMERLAEVDDSAAEQRLLRAELRYWNDRRAYIEGETARVRHEAQELERAARERAAAVEAEARQKASDMLDRVCTEASELMANARQEAREMFARHDHDLEVSRAKVDAMTKLQIEITDGLRAAMKRFEQGLQEVDSIKPSMRAQVGPAAPVASRGDAAASARPASVKPRLVPTFGRSRALAAVGATDTPSTTEPEQAAAAEPTVEAGGDAKRATLSKMDDIARLAANAAPRFQLPS